MNLKIVRTFRPHLLVGCMSSLFSICDVYEAILVDESSLCRTAVCILKLICFVADSS